MSMCFLVGDDKEISKYQYHKGRRAGNKYEIEEETSCMIIINTKFWLTSTLYLFLQSLNIQCDTPSGSEAIVGSLFFGKFFISCVSQH